MDLDTWNIDKLIQDNSVFLNNARIDIRDYVKSLNSSRDKKLVLIFPPVNNFRRFLLHQQVHKLFAKEQLSTISVGKLYARRTVIFPASLKTGNLVTNKMSNGESPTSLNAKVSHANIPKGGPKKTRKPDIEIYLPRARRRLQINNDKDCVNQSNKNTNMVLKSNQCNKRICDNVLDVTADIKNVPPSMKIPNKCEKKTKNYNLKIVNVPNENTKNESVESDVLDENKMLFANDVKNCVPSNESQNILDINVCGNLVCEVELEREKIEKYCCDSKERIIEFVRPDDRNAEVIVIDDNEAEIVSGVTVDKRKAEEMRSENTVKPANVDECDWEDLFDESGNFIDESLFKELMSAIGNVTVRQTAQDYRPFQNAEERTSDGECIIEAHGFPSDFKTDDLLSVFSAYRADKGFQISWVDDTHALVIFSSPFTADEVLNTELPLVKTRPLKNAISKSRIKARNFVLPLTARPKTCVSLARKLVSGHLGVKVNVTPEQRKAERKLLSDAREQRRLMVKQRYDAWEGTSGSGN